MSFSGVFLQIVTEDDSTQSILNETCEDEDSSYTSSSGFDDMDRPLYEVLYILQELNVYATGVLGTTYMNDEFEFELGTEPCRNCPEQEIYFREFRNQ